jgi:hypothetical protein
LGALTGIKYGRRITALGTAGRRRSIGKEAGMSNTEIVRIVSGCLPYSEALEVAREYSPLLEITVSEFMKLRKNE